MKKFCNVESFLSPNNSEIFLSSENVNFPNFLLDNFNSLQLGLLWIPVKHVNHVSFKFEIL